MKRHFIVNLLFVIVLNLLIKPIWIFGIDRTIQNHVGAEAYGLYYALFNFSLLSSFILDMGITSFNNRSIAQNKALLQHYFPGILVLKLVFSILYIGLSLLIASQDNNYIQVLPILLLLLINQVLSSLILFCRSNISGLQYFKVDSIFSILDKALALFIIAILLYGFPEYVSIQNFVIAQTLAMGTSAIIALITVMGYFKFDYSLVKVVELKKLIKSSIPYAVLFFLMMAYTRQDTILLNQLSNNGDYEVGVYAAGYRLFEAGSNFGFLLAGILLPLFTKMLSKNEDVTPIIGIAVKLFLSICTLFIVIVCFNHNKIYSLLYNEDLNIYSSQLIFFSLALFASYSNYIFGTLITANGNIKLLSAIALATIVFNLILNYTLIPQYGSYAAAIACCASQFFNAFLILSYCLLRYKISVKMRDSLSFILLPLSCALIMYVSRGHIHWLSQSLLAFVTCIIIGTLIRFFPIKSALAQIKYNK